MSATLNVTEDDLLTALRSFLLSILPAGMPVELSQVNNTSMPLDPFVMMTPGQATGLSTNRLSYNDTGVYGTGTQKNARSSEWRCQIDCYGNGASNAAQTIATLWRTMYACDVMPIDIQPLYAGEPHNTTMINDQKQYEDRWTLDLHLQYNPVVTVPQDFADKLHIDLAEIDATFPPI